MQRHFHEELDALKQTLLAMGGLVEDQIRRVMRALLERGSDLAQEVIDRDRQVNAYDVEIDEKCVELLALHQPAAGDLRFITTAMKIVTDLERIGDQAVNIAQRTIELNPEPQLKPYVDQEMARLTALGLDELAHVEAELEGIPVERVVRFGEPADEIRLEAEAFNADLVALATSRRNRLAAALRPGVVDRVIQEAPVPTLVLRD